MLKKESSRLYFIDTIRSIAILMMLEGHFITFSLQKMYRTDANPIYEIWKFTRSLTAPIFLTISGLIFTYLLLKDKQHGFQNIRLKKGAKRALLLVALGFLLQIKIYKVLFLGIPLFTELFYIFHVLHCIGICMLLIIVVYLLKSYLLNIPIGILFFLLSFGIIIFTPTLVHLDYSNTSVFLENVLIKSLDESKKVSVFPLFPWASFVFFGCLLGSLIYRFREKTLGNFFPILLITIGYILKEGYYVFLLFIDDLIKNTELTSVMSCYEFARIGHVLIFIGTIILLSKLLNILRNISFFKKLTLRVFSITAWTLALLIYFTFETGALQIFIIYALALSPIVFGLAKLIGWNQSLFFAIGQNTLIIYVLHVILLYEGFLGLTFSQLIQAKLKPTASIIGAILFIFLFVYFTKHIDLIKSKLKISTIFPSPKKLKTIILFKQKTNPIIHSLKNSNSSD